MGGNESALCCTTGRTRTYGDTNYSSSTTNLGRPYTPHYRDNLPYYSRSHYGFSPGSSLQQHDFPSYSSLSGSTYSNGSMSRYTRPYDTGSRNYDTSTRSYDSSSRLYDHSTRLGVSGSEEATESASRRYGLHAARSHDSDLKSYDVSTRKYDTGGTGIDITSSQSTSFGSGDRDSVTDHLHDPSHLDPGFRKTSHRYRNGSGDSLGSQSSEKSETKSPDSTDLFRIYRSRYQDRATHGQEPVSTSYKEPSVSYSAPKKQTNLDIDPIPELESVEKARNGERVREKERSDSLRTRDWNSRSSSREEREDPVLNQRLSERFKESNIERSDSVQSRNVQSKSDSIQSRNVQSRSDSVQTRDVQSRSSIRDIDDNAAASSRLSEKSKERVENLKFRDWKSTTKEAAELPGEPQDSKKSSEKTGDELLSNFRKAIRKHASTDEKREKDTESSRSSVQLDQSVHSDDSKLEQKKESDILSNKKSQKKESDILSNKKSQTKVEIEEVSSSDQGKSVLRRYQQSESMEKKSEETGGTKVKDKNKERIAFEGPVVDGRSHRKLKAYGKSKTADLGQLSHDTKEDEVDTSPPVPSRDDASLVSTHTRDELSEMTREERISRYKEERKRQLAALAETFDSGKSDVDALPSLFLSQTSEASPLARSQSLKAEKDLQAAVSLSRSRSMKEDSEKLKQIEDEKKQRIKEDEQEYELSEDKKRSKFFVDDDHTPSPSFKPLGITGLLLAERASEILRADQLPQKKAPLDSRLFDHMQNLRKLQQQHRAKEKISIDELKAKRLSRDTEDLEAMHALSINESKEEKEKDTLSLRMGEKRQRDEKVEIPSAVTASDSEGEKQKSRMRRKLPSIEDILGTNSGSSTPDTIQSVSPAHVGSLSSQSSLSTQSTSSQKLSSRTSSSGSEVSTSRASSSLSEASKCSRIPTTCTISEDVFHDTGVSKKDAQDHKGDHVLTTVRSRTPSGGQPMSDSAKKSSDEALSLHKVIETSSTKIERNKAPEVKPFGTVYYRPRDKDHQDVQSSEEEQKQSVKIPVTKISYRDLERKERETKSPHKIEKESRETKSPHKIEKELRETKSSHKIEESRETKSLHMIERETKTLAATESRYKPSSDLLQSDKTQKEPTRQVLSSKEQEKSKIEDEKEQSFVSVERDSKTTLKNIIESSRERYLENIVKRGDVDSLQQPSKKDFGVSYIGTATQECTKNDERKRHSQEVNIDPNLLLGKNPVILDGTDGDSKKNESKIRGKQVEPKSLLHDSSKSVSFSQIEVKSKERVVPTSSQQSHERVVPASGQQSHERLVPTSSKQSHERVVPTSSQQSHERVVPTSSQQSHERVVPTSREQSHERVVPTSSQQSNERVVPTSSQQSHERVVPSSSQPSHERVVPTSSQQSHERVVPTSIQQSHERVVPSSSLHSHERVVPTSNQQSHERVVPTSSQQSQERVVPTSREQSHERVVPTSNQQSHERVVPTSSQQSHERVVPTSSQQSHERVVPTSSQQSHERVVPTSSQQSHERVVPTSSQQSHERVVPSSSQQSHERVVPTSSQQSHERVVPTSSQQSHERVVPTSSQQSHERVVPTSSQQSHERVVPTSSQQSHERVVPTSSQQSHERVVPTSSQQSHERETKEKDNSHKVCRIMGQEEKSDLVRLPLDLERKECQRSQEKEPVCASHLVSSSYVSFQTKSSEQRPEAKPTVSKKSLEKSLSETKEFGVIRFPSISYQRRTPERRIEPTESESKQPMQQAGIDTVILLDKSNEKKADVGKPITDVKVDEKGIESKILLLSSKGTPDISDLKVEIKPTTDSERDTSFTVTEKKNEIPETRTVKLSRKPRIGEDTKVLHKYLASREAPVVSLPSQENLDRKEEQTQIHIKEAKTDTCLVISTEESSVAQARILQKSVQGRFVDSEETFTEPVETVESKRVIHEETLKSIQVPKSNTEEPEVLLEKHIVAQIKPEYTVSQTAFQTLESKTVHQNKQETSSVESRIHETLESEIVPLSSKKISDAETVPDKYHDESMDTQKVSADLKNGKAEIVRVDGDVSVFKKERSTSPTICAVVEPSDTKLKREGSPYTDAKTPTLPSSSLPTSKDVQTKVEEVPVPPATVVFFSTPAVSSTKEKSANVERKPSKGKKFKPKLVPVKKKELIEKRAGGSPLRLLDTTLDDILGKNLEYLSDLEAREIFNRKSKAEASFRPKSIHEVSPNRSLNKEALKKSQSMPEQRDLPTEDVEEDKQSEIKEIQKDPVKVRGMETKLTDVKAVPLDRNAEAVEEKPEATTSTEKQEDTTLIDESRVTKSGPQTASSSDMKSEYNVENQSRSEKFKDEEAYSLVSKEAIHAQKFTGDLAEKSQPVSGGSIEIMTILYVDNTKPNDARSTGEINKDSLSLSDVVSSQNKDVITSLTPVTRLEDVTTRMEVTSFYSDTQASDASDRSERHRAQAHDLDFVKDEISRMTTTDSDSLSQTSQTSQTSHTSDASRKKRKDKAALRKSKVNEAVEGDDSRGRSSQRPGSPRTNKISLRKTSSRAVSDVQMSDKTPDSPLKEEAPTTSVKHESASQLTKHIPTDMASSSLHSKASNTEGSTSSSLHGRAIQTPILSSQTVLPSKFALPSKVSAAITKLSEAKEASQSSKKKDDELSKSPRRIARGNNFNKLLEKFSSSDASSSEKSDHDSSSRRKLPLRRQEAYSVSSGSSDETGTRRTPERTQSFKVQGTASLEENLKDTTVQRSSSFKSEFMKRRFSPEPLNRRQLPVTPEPSDKPSEELAKVLDKRSHIVAEQQTVGEISEREKIHDKRVEKAEQFSSAGVDEVIADSEVASVLKARQKETDSIASREVECQERYQAKANSDRLLAAGMEKVIADTEVLSSLQSRKRETDFCSQKQEKENVDKPDKSRLVKNLSSKSSVHEISSISSPSLSVAPLASLRSHLSSQSSQKIKLENGKKDPLVSEHQITKSTSETNRVKQASDHLVLGPKISESVPTVPKLDLSAIDTSLDVLNQVTNEIDRKYDQHDPLHSKGAQLSEALSKIHVDSPREVVQFIKSVQNEQISNSSASITADSFERKPVPVTSESELKDTMKYERDFKRESSPRIENTAKKDIIKMFSREVTPDRTSPSRNVPVKVTSSFQGSSSSPALKRTESAGRAESVDRPKGILKRSPSLKQSGVIVDPELASIMKSRRARQGDMDEEEEWKRTTALEDIKQAREQKLQERGGVEEDEEEKLLPISERIFHMENKIEEAKSSPVTPKSRSGLTTPKSVQNVSGTVTPKSQFSFDEGLLSVPDVVSDQLLQKLTNLKERGSTLSMRREAFQKRKHDDWRTRTQPVTQEEITEADGLESVRKFRLEILRKASSNIFENAQHQTKPGPEGVKTEYPQSFRKDNKKLRCSRLQRHKTLPVTAAELGAIPEDKSLTAISLQQKIEAFGMRDSKGDSGILSGSEADSSIEKESSQSDSLRSLDTDLPDDDPSKLSVLAKATMFQKIEKTRSSASGAKRYIARKKRERSKTQPVTEEEVKTAAEIADNEKETEYKEDEHEEKGEEKGEKEQEKREEEDLHDDLSRRSLAEKVKLFSSLKDAEEKAAQKTDAPVTKKRNRKLQPSRFATQPITVEEVEKASKISPLAMSLVKPPDPELLRGLSFQAQRDLMAKHAEVCLSQPGSRSGSQHTSTTDLTEELKSTQKDILQPVEIGAYESVEVKSILKESCTSSEKEIKGGLKTDTEKQESYESKSIFKYIEHSEDSDHEIKGILRAKDKPTTVSEDKRMPSELVKSEIDQVKEKNPGGILKMESMHSVTTTSSGILKTESVDSSIKKSILTETKSVLKTESLFEKVSETRGILKKDSSFETKKLEPDKPILKSSDSSENKEYTLVKGILKKKEEEEEKEKEDTGSSEEYFLAHEENSGSPSSEREETGREIDVDTPKMTGDDKTNRRQFRHRKGQTERYKTQPAEVTPEGTPQTDGGRKKIKYSGRHLTQPVTPEEKKEAEIATEMVEVKNSGSVAERLNALKKSGDEEWKKRVSRDLDLDQLKTPSPVVVRMREKKEFSTPRPSSIADRLTLLKSAGEDWRGRIEEKDAKQFTVAHKIESSGHGLNESPLVARLKKTPRSEVIVKDFDSGESSDFPSPTTPTKESSKIPLPKEVIFTTEVEIEGKSGTIPTLNAVTEESKEPVQVEVPKLDEELDSFFSEQSTTEVREKTACTVDDFDELFIMANEILTSTRKIKPKRKHTAHGRNPLKTMSANLEVRSEYTEVIRGVAEKELRRIKTSQIAQHAGFAVEALAGLASKENFSKVELRKTETSAAAPGPLRYEPYQDLMLLHIKGRRRVQIRLVEPCAASLNSGDCYILVTNDQIIQWNGDYSNVIEKAKAADVADYIKQKKDLGCKNAQSVTVLEEKKSNICGGMQFWKALGGCSEYMGSGPTEEDELYENHIVETNMVYHLDNNSLVPVEEYWGNVPKFDMLKSDEIFVFDYGSELYVWQGKTVKPGQRKTGMKLARQLWDRGYDYSACHINPVSPLRTEESGGLPFKFPTRPPWAIFGKVNENMETILFREKFSDWPDTSRLIKVKSQEEISENKEVVELTPYDARLMLPENTTPVTLVLEGSHVGRGTKWFEDMEGFVRELDIVTLDVVVWHVLEYDHYKLPDHSYGQFHEGDTYVVRWQYMIITAGARDLKGQQSKISNAGRERCAYFFWQGKSSTINEKGASALMTVELDEERGPQIRVSEGKEPPCFLNLFKGNMIIHIGKREDETTNTPGTWRFYSVRNELENEICLLEVPTNMSSLRSRSSFLILNVNTGLLYVWHGCKSPQHTRKLAVAASNKLKEKCPLEVGLHQKAAVVVTEMEEGEEKLEFWRLMDVTKNDRSAYFSLLKDSRSFTHTLRLFHMTSVSGVFEVHEILNPSRTRDYFSPFPVIQADLYKASQPGLFLVDSGFEVYLWQGWWPEGDKEQENVHTGSAVARLNIDRKCALETTLQYCKEKNPGNPCKAYVAYGGLEPLKFTNLFPFWTVDEAARESNLKDGKKEGEELVEELLKRVSKIRYTFAELQECPLPEGVNPLKLEWYLSDEEFMDVIEMSKDEFYALPAWKQTKIKQQVGLF